MHKKSWNTWESGHSHESCSVVFWSQTSLTSWPWKLANFQFSVWLTWMGKKWYNCAGLLNFPNATAPNGSSYGSETSHFAGGLTLKRVEPPFFTDASFTTGLSLLSPLLQLSLVRSWCKMSVTYNITLHRWAAFRAGCGNGAGRPPFMGWHTFKNHLWTCLFWWKSGISRLYGEGQWQRPDRWKSHTAWLALK